MAGGTAALDSASQVLLDRAVLPLGRMELLPDCEGAADAGRRAETAARMLSPEFVRMDASVLWRTWRCIQLCTLWQICRVP